MSALVPQVISHSLDSDLHVASYAPFLMPCLTAPQLLKPFLSDFMASSLYITSWILSSASCYSGDLALLKTLVPFLMAFFFSHTPHIMGPQAGWVLQTECFCLSHLVSQMVHSRIVPIFKIVIIVFDLFTVKSGNQKA